MRIAAKTLGTMGTLISEAAAIDGTWKCLFDSICTAQGRHDACTVWDPSAAVMMLWTSCSMLRCCAFCACCNKPNRCETWKSVYQGPSWPLKKLISEVSPIANYHPSLCPATSCNTDLHSETSSAQMHAWYTAWHTAWQINLTEAPGHNSSIPMRCWLWEMWETEGARGLVHWPTTALPQPRELSATEPFDCLRLSQQAKHGPKHLSLRNL